MKAIIHTGYGPPEELQLKDVDKPVPKDNEVLIKIRATTVSTTDCNFRNLTFVTGLFSFLSRLQFGFFKPRNSILGMDLAGEIEEVGKDVKRFKPGDQVFGTPAPNPGTHAEYICIPEDGALVQMPSNMTFDEAAAIPTAANTALYFIRDLGRIQSGQKILINGASGGIGTYAVQLAKYYGANVTGVCSTQNIDLVESLGADEVIDYTKQDFAGRVYDVIFDVASKSTFSRSKKSLKKKGVYLVTLPKPTVFLQVLWTSMFGGKKVKISGAPVKLETLRLLKNVVEEGKLITAIDRRYPLDQVADAYRYVEKGHKKGNVVIKVAGS